MSSLQLWLSTEVRLYHVLQVSNAIAGKRINARETGIDVMSEKGSQTLCVTIELSSFAMLAVRDTARRKSSSALDNRGSAERECSPTPTHERIGPDDDLSAAAKRALFRLEIPRIFAHATVDLPRTLVLVFALSRAEGWSTSNAPSSVRSERDSS